MIHNCPVCTPSAAMRKPDVQHSVDKTIAFRGPLRSIQVPPNAAERPSITIAIEKITAIAVSEEPKRSTRGSLKTENAEAWPIERLMASAAGGISHRL